MYESLDIEDVDNTVYRAASAARWGDNTWIAGTWHFLRNDLLHADCSYYLGSTPIIAVADASLKWIVCLLIGGTTAVAAFLVNLGVENIAGLKFYLTLAVIERSG